MLKQWDFGKGLEGRIDGSLDMHKTLSYNFWILKAPSYCEMENKYNCFAARFKDEIHFFNKKGLLLFLNCSVTALEVLST